MHSDVKASSLSDRLVASVSHAGSPRTSPDLYRSLLRLLSRGDPVTIDQLATAAGHRSKTCSEL